MLDKIKKTLMDGKEYRIIFLGDSITSCEWVHPNWPEIVEYVLKSGDLADELGDWRRVSWGVRCINYGYDGSTTEDLLTLVDRVIALKPDLVLFLFGRNDMDFRISVEKHKENTKKLLEILSQNVPDTYYMSTIACADDELNKKFEAYIEAEKALFPIENVKLIDLFNLYKNFNYKSFFSFKHDEFDIDTIPGTQDIDHPNQLGNAYIAKIILKEVFGLEFNADKYIQENNSGKKSPAF